MAKIGQKTKTCNIRSGASESEGGYTGISEVLISDQRQPCARRLINEIKALVHVPTPRGDRDETGVHQPAFCFSRIFAATSSLARCCSDPVMVFLLFYKSRETVVSFV